MSTYRRSEGTGGAVHEAVTREHYRIANLLYDHGAAVDATPDACMPTMDELYNAAIESGAPPDLVRIGFEDHLGPASAAAPKDDAPEVVKLFHRVLRLGGKPTLSSVVRQEHHELMRELLTKRATEPAQRYDSPPGTVFQKIADAESWLGYPEILEMCSRGATRNYTTQNVRDSQCAVRLAVTHRDGCHPEYYRLIENQLKFLEDRNELDHTLMSPLHWLADNFLQSRTYGFKCQQLPTVDDLIEFAELFLKYGFDVNFRCTKSNKTPLAVAAGEGPLAYVEFLIARGANLCTDDPGETNPLAIAKRKSRKDVIGVLRFCLIA